jgi:hypothetical protein
MSWLRVDDSEVLDDRIGDLTDREYRAWHALLDAPQTFHLPTKPTGAISLLLLLLPLRSEEMLDRGSRFLAPACDKLSP